MTTDRTHLIPFLRTVDHLGTFAIKANKSLHTKAAVWAYIEELTAEHKELQGFEHALVDVVNTHEDDVVDIYVSPDELADGFLSSTNGVRLLWMPKADRAALNSFQAGEWQWTDASSPNDALRRYLEDDMQP